MSNVLYSKIKLNDAFDEFIFQKLTGGDRERTIEDHKQHLDYFMRFAKLKNKDITYLDQVSNKFCREYIIYMLQEKVVWDDHKEIKKDKKGLSPATINIRTSSLKAQFNFYVSEGYLECSPWEGIKKLKVDESEIKFLSENDYFKLLKAPNRRTYNGFRDYVVLNILIDNGCRIGETIDLTLEDINFDESYLRYPGPVTKNRQFRIVPISKRISFLIRQLIELNKSVNDEAYHIFLSENGNQLNADSFRSSLNTLKKRAGIKTRVTPHMLRHTFCVEYLRKGGDLESMMEICGHLTYKAAKKYARLVPDVLREKKEKHSPLSPKKY